MEEQPVASEAVEKGLNLDDNSESSEEKEKETKVDK